MRDAVELLVDVDGPVLEGLHGVHGGHGAAAQGGQEALGGKGRMQKNSVIGK